MHPLSFSEIATRLSFPHLCQNKVLGFSIDSRKIHEGELFFALPGNKVDGHLFLKEISEKKAVGAVVHENYAGDDFNLPLIRVPNVLDALQNLARMELQKRKSKVIAITGSLGKTTTKEFAKTLISTTYSVFASPSSYNSQATLPLSILMAKGDEEILILEMGMTHPGQIQSLLSIAPPDVALLTTVAMQHAIHFSNGLLGISLEKGSIFSHPKTTRGIMPRDIEHYEEVFNKGCSQKKSFSLTKNTSDYYLEQDETRVRIFEKKELVFEAPHFLSLKVHYQNFLAACSLARELTVSWAKIREALPLLKLPAMRFEKIEKNGIIFINDAFNAYPEATEAALESLPQPSIGGKKIAVLSEMDALGAYSELGHLKVAKKALAHIDLLLCIGGRCKQMVSLWQDHKKPAHLFHSKEELIQKLKEMVKIGDVVLLKGARFYSLDKILDFF